VLELRSVIGFLHPVAAGHGKCGFAAMRTPTPRRPHRPQHHPLYRPGAVALCAYLIPLAVLISIEFRPRSGPHLAVSFLGEGFRVPGCGDRARPDRRGRHRAAQRGSMDTGHLAFGRGGLLRHRLVLVKSMTKTESVVRIIFWMLIIQSAVGLIPALYDWHNPRPGFGRDLPDRLHRHVVAFLPARALSMPTPPHLAYDFCALPLSALVLAALSRADRLFTAGGAALILAGNLLNLQRRRQGGGAEAATRSKRPRSVELATPDFGTAYL